MGQGGQFQLMNYTPYNWVKTSEHSYQMNNWTLPAQIPAWSSEQVYVEWGASIGSNVWDDAADSTYSIQGTGTTFTLSARAVASTGTQAGYFHLVVQMGSVQGLLGWVQNGTTTFALAGLSGGWCWTGMNGSSWMQDNLSLLGNRTLREIAIPGAHDAGMSMNAGSTAGGNTYNTQAQSLNIAGQLAQGTRFFDIRPVLSGGQYVTGHYSNLQPSIATISLGNTWQGANGESIQSIISDINTFTSQQKELVILDLSHSLDTDVGNSSYCSFTTEQYATLLKQMQSLNHLFISTASDLTQLTLSEFIGGGSSAVVIIVEEDYQFEAGSDSIPGIQPMVSIPPQDDINSLALSGLSGVYPKSSFNIVNEYADTDTLSTMISDQFTKMASNTGNYFLLSWTLTQDTQDAIGLGPSILQLGLQANEALPSNLLGQNHTGFPNIILTDNIQNPQSTTVAMCVHWSVGQYVPLGNYLQSCWTMTTPPKPVAQSPRNSNWDVTVTIQAQCNPEYGSAISSSLTYNLTQAISIGDISNENGTLTIVQGNSYYLNPTNKYGPYIPAGSYQNSCSAITITLSAYCLDYQGVYTQSTLSYTAQNASTISQITNNNGVLTIVSSS